MDLYLRPETAQGIFEFLKRTKTSRHKLPFDCTNWEKPLEMRLLPRQFIFRMREFEQMEMQFFVPFRNRIEILRRMETKRLNWHLVLGFGQENYKFHDHEKMALRECCC